jgi:hypothetical protein
MQPHSMASMAFASHIWNNGQNQNYLYQEITGAEVEVEYRDKHGKYRDLFYRINVVNQSADKRELQLYVVRSNGGIACTMTVRRNSLQEGAHITMTHSQQHVAGLREEFQLMKKSITQGHHYNSEKYKNYKGQILYEGREVDLETDVIIDSHRGLYVTLPYKVFIKSVQTKKIGESGPW